MNWTETAIEIESLSREMENGHGGNLADKFSGLALNDKGNDSNNNSNSNNNNNDSLFQVMKAVEAAEATIKQQVSSLFLLFYFVLS